ncbi:MAG: hypothetical protein AAB225_23515 [Acidobacteriota bacterium]
MGLHGLKKQDKRGHDRGVTICFRLVYYALVFLVAAVMTAVLYLGSLLE